MAIEINDNTDWKKLTDQGLETVVDPLVFRCGELFLKGANAAANPNAVWELLNVNLYGIGMFFDALVINEKLPVFNYGDTFDSQLNFDQRALTEINDSEEVLYDVNVGWDAYHEVKNAALDELEKIFNGELPVPPNMRDQIFRELSAADYQWSPAMERLEPRLQDYHDKLLADYILGGLIFGGYAQQMNGDHLLQPKRSRLFLALSLRAPSAGRDIEDFLFEDLKKRTNSAVEDLPWLPTFFPYLLSVSETPTEVLQNVIEMRSSPEVKDYRAWLGEVLDDWKKNGRITAEKRKDVRKIVEGVDRKTGKISAMPQIELKAKIAEIAAGVPSPEINFTPAVSGIWGWFLGSLPGNRYRKLLTRAIAADSEFAKIENRIRTVWNAG